MRSCISAPSLCDSRTVKNELSGMRVVRVESSLVGRRVTARRPRRLESDRRVSAAVKVVKD
jgi:hypothetical protein